MTGGAQGRERTHRTDTLQRGIGAGPTQHVGRDLAPPQRAAEASLDDGGAGLHQLSGPVAIVGDVPPAQHMADCAGLQVNVWGGQTDPLHVLVQCG